MPGINVNHPATPSGLALAPGHGMWVADTGLRGAIGLMVPAVRAWAAQADGSMHQFWPAAPVVISGPTVGPSVVNVNAWTVRNISWNIPTADSVSLTARVGSNAPVTIYSGPNTNVEWGWFNAAAQFQPGALIIYELTAVNTAGSVVVSATVAAPTVPAPLAAPTASAITASSVHLDWNTAQVYDAQDYVVSRTPSPATKVVPGTLTDMTGLAASTTYSFQVAARALATYVGATLVTGPYGPVRTAKTLAPAETGPGNGTYTIEPTAATYQWGESGGQAAAWRSTSDDYFHGDGSSYGSNRGQQGTFFFYARPAAWAGGIGTKTCSRVQIYLLRQSSTGNSANQTCRWGVHTYASKPAGAPAVIGSYDAGALAWGEGAWIDLPVAWGAALVAGTYRGFVWGKVAARYMSCARNPAAATPNGTIRVTIAN